MRFIRCLLLCLGIVGVHGCGAENNMSNLRADITELSGFDVSILYPLPVNENHLNYMDISKINQKPIVPMDILGDFIRIGLVGPVVLGVRLDPCFPDIARVGGCIPQIRLAMQSVSNGSFAEDDAFHFLYKIPSEELQNAITEISQLRLQSGFSAQELKALPLQVHPALISSVFAKGLKQILLKYLADDRLMRVTKVNGERRSLWNFRGLNINGGQIEEIGIPGLENIFGATTEEQFRFRDNGAHALDVSIQAEDDMSVLFQRQNINLTTLPSDQVFSAVKAAFKIESPSFHSPETTDCVSCHVAQQTRLKAKNIVSGMEFSDVKYEGLSGMNMESLYQDSINFQTMRAFGYDGRQPIITQRVINETDAVLNFIKNQ